MAVTMAQGSGLRAQGQAPSPQPPAPSGLRQRGQSAIEYAALIGIVVAALVGMSVYTKRALMGKWRQAGDTFGHGRQFEPGRTAVTRTAN